MGNSGYVGSQCGIYIPKIDDTRRHKSRCLYYHKPNCTLLSKFCSSSAHCDHYSEKRNSVLADELFLSSKIKLNTSKQFRIGKHIIDKLGVGNRVKHKVFGEGNVIHLDGEIITISFDNGNKCSLNLNMCIQKNLLSF